MGYYLTEEIQEDMVKELAEYLGATEEFEEEEYIINENKNNVPYLSIKIDGGEYLGFKQYEDAEEEMVNRSMESDYLWREAVAHGDTTDSLEKWAMNGDVPQELATYDSYEISTKSGYHFYRTN